jgi:hypothetical protein
VTLQTGRNRLSGAAQFLAFFNQYEGVRKVRQATSALRYAKRTLQM